MDGNNVGGDILLIDQVDLDLLDEQRLSLVKLRQRMKLSFEEDEEQALDGIINMLDEWSDDRAREEERHAIHPEGTHGRDQGDS